LAESADHPKLQTPGIGKLAESADPLNLQTTQTSKLGESADHSNLQTRFVFETAFGNHVWTRKISMESQEKGTRV
jgi:hypothetical protein